MSAVRVERRGIEYFGPDRHRMGPSVDHAHCSVCDWSVPLMALGGADPEAFHCCPDDGGLLGDVRYAQLSAYREHMTDAEWMGPGLLARWQVYAKRLETARANAGTDRVAKAIREAGEQQRAILERQQKDFAAVIEAVAPIAAQIVTILNGLLTAEAGTTKVVSVTAAAGSDGGKSVRLESASLARPCAECKRREGECVICDNAEDRWLCGQCYAEEFAKERARLIEARIASHPDCACDGLLVHQYAGKDRCGTCLRPALGCEVCRSRVGATYDMGPPCTRLCLSCARGRLEARDAAARPLARFRRGADRVADTACYAGLVAAACVPPGLAAAWAVAALVCST